MDKNLATSRNSWSEPELINSTASFGDSLCCTAGLGEKDEVLIAALNTVTVHGG